MNKIKLETLKRLLDASKKYHFSTIEEMINKCSINNIVYENDLLSEIEKLK